MKGIKSKISKWLSYFHDDKVAEYNKYLATITIYFSCFLGIILGTGSFIKKFLEWDITMPTRTSILGFMVILVGINIIEPIISQSKPLKILKDVVFRLTVIIIFFLLCYFMSWFTLLALTISIIGLLLAGGGKGFMDEITGDKFKGKRIKLEDGTIIDGDKSALDPFYRDEDGNPWERTDGGFRRA